MSKSPVIFLTYKEKSQAILFKSKKIRTGPLRRTLDGFNRFPTPAPPPKVQTLSTPLFPWHTVCHSHSIPTQIAFFYYKQLIANEKNELIALSFYDFHTRSLMRNIGALVQLLILNKIIAFLFNLERISDFDCNGWLLILLRLLMEYYYYDFIGLLLLRGFMYR